VDGLGAHRSGLACCLRGRGHRLFGPGPANVAWLSKTISTMPLSHDMGHTQQKRRHCMHSCTTLKHLSTFIYGTWCGSWRRNYFQLKTTSIYINYTNPISASYAEVHRPAMLVWLWVADLVSSYTESDTWDWLEVQEHSNSYWAPINIFLTHIYPQSI
jgi:hypothetical protein